VVLWADHGYQLGDNGQWGKHTDFEHATHIPFLVRLPSASFPKFTPGARSAAFLENVDLFPTLVELAMPDEAAVPLCPIDANATRAIELCTEGVSFAPLLMDLNATWKSASFSQYHRLGWNGASDPPKNRLAQGGEEEEAEEEGGEGEEEATTVTATGPSAGNAMGYSIRTAGWRYTLWVPYDFTAGGYPSSMKWDSDSTQAELYEHADEKSLCKWDFEHVNLAGDPAHAATEAQLRRRLVAGWRAAVPHAASTPQRGL
jgi:iduronate 2-sulfatase